MSAESNPGKRSFTDLFIKRPVIAIVVNLVIVIAGVQAIRLNVRQVPPQ
jgi:multidrug efflux pump